MVVAASYLRPAGTGDAEIATTVVRTGRTMSTGFAELSQAGKAVLRLEATFGCTRRTSSCGTGPGTWRHSPASSP